VRAAALAIVLLAAQAARADVDFLGPARKISRGWSASRDTPVMNLLVLPRDVRTAGAELALLTAPFSDFTLRMGFAGLIELESEGETEALGNLFPKASGAILWRGSYAYFVAFALDALGPRLCASCELETALSYRHESQHYTGSNSGDPGRDVTHEPFIGDDVIVDGALRHRAGDWLFVERLVVMWFLPDRSSYSAGLGADLHLRWLRWRRLQPFVSFYAERLFGDDLEGREFPDAYLVRGLAGIALPSALGDILVYLSGDVGHRKGILGLTEEATLGLGVRLSLGH